MDKKLRSFTIFAEINVLVGALPTIFAPLMGFVAACVQMRFKQDYMEYCYDETHLMRALRLV